MEVPSKAYMEQMIDLHHVDWCRWKGGGVAK